MIRYVLALVLFATPAFAQQQQSPVEQRIANQIGTLVIQNTAQAAQIEALTAELTRLRAELDALKKPADQK